MDNLEAMSEQLRAIAEQKVFDLGGDVFPALFNSRFFRLTPGSDPIIFIIFSCQGEHIEGTPHKSYGRAEDAALAWGELVKRYLEAAGQGGVLYWRCYPRVEQWEGYTVYARLAYVVDRARSKDHGQDRSDPPAQAAGDGQADPAEAYP